MLYRKHPRGGENIGIIGMGTAKVGSESAAKAAKTFEYALDHGINYYDFAGAHGAIFPGMGQALKGRRKDAMLQVHFGTDYSSGEYGWNISLEGVKRSIDWQMTTLGIDYIDFGFIHCLDEEADLNEYINNGVLEYIQSLQKEGVVKHIGLSTHAPEMANRVLDMDVIDTLMFPINPMYDYGTGTYCVGSGSERTELYNRCVREKVGITVMKPYSGAQLLDARQSTFRQALPVVKCLQYALDRPGVLTVLPGATDIDQLKSALAYLDASEEERDYSIISTFTPEDSKGRCVYCRHCHPCPAGLDVGLINKYYDLARVGDELAREHYLTLGKTASDCVSCGHCDKRCPFGVEQVARMAEIKSFFGK